ncbi:hypothetical protein GOC74_16765 [Halomicrobium mukohataei]|uniref:Nucleotide pyrophosphatase n=1 Tax=Halomicrobium mukohataei TaxID=57705 RepID=A0A847U003_9EURY|nr:hypothetical protein [Halomicrobium mukohataei]NLV11582.1 hypothetical protein [Halomicrobium mukohataei]
MWTATVYNLEQALKSDRYAFRGFNKGLETDLEAATGLNGEPIARSIHRPDEVYSGEYLDRAPDLIFDQRPGVHTGEAMGQTESFTEPSGWNAENVPDGMVLFHGDDIEPGEIDPIQITDIEPTILDWLGLSVPTDMDGSPVKAIFNNSSTPAQRSTETR